MPFPHIEPAGAMESPRKSMLMPGGELPENPLEEARALYRVADAAISADEWAEASAYATTGILALLLSNWDDEPL